MPPTRADADVVDQDVDPPERGHAGQRHRLDARRPGHVGGVGGADPALAFDDALGLVRGLEVAIDAEHLGALAREQHRGRLAVAPARPDRPGAGDQRDLVLQSPAHAVASPAR
jgi:hypothetical protein